MRGNQTQWHEEQAKGTQKRSQVSCEATWLHCPLVDIMCSEIGKPNVIALIRNNKVLTLSTLVCLYLTDIVLVIKKINGEGTF